MAHLHHDSGDVLIVDVQVCFKRTGPEGRWSESGTKRIEAQCDNKNSRSTCTRQNPE